MNGVDVTVSADLGISLDGFIAGPDQSREDPLGIGGERLHTWMFNEPEANADVIAAITAPGAFIMGRNMFCPIRGAWSGEWNGWWGEDPPYHAPVFVLTHYPREPVVMQGGTTFTFVTDGIQSAMSQALAATTNGDIAIAGGASTVRQFLGAGLIDELRLHIAPVLLGAGERLFDGMTDLAADPVAVSGNSGPDGVTHITYRIGTG
jgi:dihydrofolate reductase